MRFKLQDPFGLEPIFYRPSARTVCGSRPNRERHLTAVIMAIVFALVEVTTLFTARTHRGALAVWFPPAQRVYRQPHGRGHDFHQKGSTSLLACKLLQFACLRRYSKTVQIFRSKCAKQDAHYNKSCISSVLALQYSIQLTGTIYTYEYVVNNVIVRLQKSDKNQEKKTIK